MTNVKLKLLYFLLNIILSADITHSRPYSTANVSDIILNFNNNSTFTIPVESNSDTLTVANDDEKGDGKEETAEETNKSSNLDMEDIVNAEQDRDEALSEKVIKDQVSILEMSKNEAEAFEKQLNTSSALLDEMIDSESDREETLTDILFRPESEFVEGPRFEFLIARMNDSVTNRTLSDNLGKMDRNGSDLLKKVDYVELVEVDKPTSENKSAYIGNITGHEVDNDLAPDTRFTDVQTLFLACFGTLLPLLAVLFAILLVRCLCRRWCPGCARKSTDSSVSLSTDKPDNNHQSKSSEDGDEDSQPANGSIFTMTLKNNHLIVETEERNDITKNGRETKMKYSPDNDGIFVVEVQQSASYRPNKSSHNSPPHDPHISTNLALIHRVPEELEKGVSEDSERRSDKYGKQALALSSTGLSISDLSMSSIGSHNISYSYSSQVGYEQGPFGYPVYAGYHISKDEVSEGITHDNSQEPLIGRTPTDPDKPVVTAAIFKQDSIIGNNVLQGTGYCIEGSSDGPLLSDVQAREVSLQKLHDKNEKKLENGLPHRIVIKCESPIHVVHHPESLPSYFNDYVGLQEAAMEDVSLNDVKSEKTLPMTRTDMYESVKEVISGGSPKFEKLRNEMSPGENSYDNPPMITITEENEPRLDSNS